MKTKKKNTVQRKKGVITINVKKMYLDMGSHTIARVDGSIKDWKIQKKKTPNSTDFFVINFLFLLLFKGLSQ